MCPCKVHCVVLLNFLLVPLLRVLSVHLSPVPSGIVFPVSKDSFSECEWSLRLFSCCYFCC